MIICKVCGRCQSTVRCPEINGLRLAYLDPVIDDETKPANKLIAVDPFGCKVGDMVMVARGSSVNAGMYKPVPIDAMIIGIIDG